MEKIYMENNNNKKQSTISQVMNAKLPHHLSALMIMVAFVSFIAMGFSQESYSITQEELGDSFTAITATHGNFRRIGGTNTEANTPETAGSDYYDDKYDDMGIKAFKVPYMETTNGIQVFCLDKKGVIPTYETNAVNYSNSKTKVDAGVSYILSQHGKHGLNKYVETWITQVAIWEYQYEKDNTANDMGTYINYIKRDNAIVVCKSNTDVCDASSREDIQVANIYTTYIQPLVANAKNATSSSLAITKASGDLTVTDNNYYKSQIMTVSGLSNGSTYSLKLTNAPSGTKVYKIDGTEITDLNSIDANTNQFYLLVPINKVTENTKNLTVSVTGPSSVAYIYKPTTIPTSGVYQTLTAPVDEVVNVGVDLTYAPGVPDTGMSTTQSVYFIGLVILLCGIGIIYANSKPRKSE